MAEPFVCHIALEGCINFRDLGGYGVMTGVRFVGDASFAAESYT